MRCMGFLTGEKLAEEAARYGKAGARPQVVWPTGVLASTAVGLAMDIVTGWTGRPLPHAYLVYDGNKGTVKVRIKFNNRDNRILNQMEVRVAFLERNPNAPRRPGILVPRVALQDKAGAQFVWVVKDGRAQRRTVTVADYVGDQVLVSAGLSGGEAVVVDKQIDLSEGKRIQQAKP